MALYMLDTDISSYIMKTSSGPLLKRLYQTNVADVCMSVITKSELLYGVAISPRQERDQTALNDLLRFVAVLGLPEEAALHYADIRSALKIAGQPIGANDLWIAAHARCLGSTLVTNNTREFSRVQGLRIENWT